MAPLSVRTTVPAIRQLQWVQRGAMRTMAHSKLPKDIGAALLGEPAVGAVGRIDASGE